MEPRISFVTLVVADLDAARRFYIDGLGWPAAFEVPGEVVMVKAAGSLVISLWERSHAEAEMGRIGAIDGAPPFTLAHNMPTREGVDEVLAAARAAGAPLVQAGVARDWGGYSGYFADPAGFRWEVAHNPSEIGEYVLA